ncbi:MAG: nucleotidyltransferase domain-containing protein [archaeon]|jgi:hypothetical protein
MIPLFDEFVGFKVLRFFCLNPSKELNINELAKELKISSFSAKKYCDLLLKEEMLLVKPIGNQKRFSLNNSSVYVKQLKRAIALLYFKEKGIENIAKDANSFAIYGSFANGSFEKYSDLDLLIIGPKGCFDRSQLTKFGKEIKREIQLVDYTYPAWFKMKKEKHPFAEEITRKHILVRGNEL